MSKISENGANVFVFGLGNPYRRDDGAAAAVLALLTERNLSGAVLQPLLGDPMALLDKLQAGNPAVIVDAVQANLPAGTVVRVNAHNYERYRGKLGNSTHALSLLDALALADKLKQLPARWEVVGIVGEDFSRGDVLSESVSDAIEPAMQVIIEMVRQYQR